MEKFVNEYIEKLSHALPESEIKVAREILYLVLNNYEVSPRHTQLAVIGDAIPEEAKQYIVTKKIEGKTDATLHQYLNSIKRFVRHVRKPFKDVTTNDIRVYLFAIAQETHMSDRSLDNQRLYLSAFFGWLTLNGYIDKDPSALIPKIKYEKKMREPLSDMEMECVRAACKNVLEKTVIEVLYSTGCRVSELVAIKVSDINFEARTVTLHGKGKKQRTGYLNAKAMYRIRQQRKGIVVMSPYLFANEKGGHYSIRFIERMVSDIGKRAKISGDLFPHRIRHTTATDALKRGMNVEQVQIMLGHVKIETTLEYAKVNTDEIREKHEKCIV